MIFSKILLNKLVDVLKDKFKIDKMFDYVFDDNELDEKVKNLENRTKIIETIISTNMYSCKKGDK
jgi:hypothetical protein